MDTTDTTTVRLPRDLVEQIRKLAIHNDRSLSAELREALRAYIHLIEQTWAGNEHAMTVYATYAMTKGSES